LSETSPTHGAFRSLTVCERKQTGAEEKQRRWFGGMDLWDHTSLGEGPERLSPTHRHHVSGFHGANKRRQRT
jgi:hypothetical protein